MQKLILIAVLFFASTTFAQTPFDSFDTSMKSVPLFKSDKPQKFRLVNVEHNANVKFIDLNVESRTLEYYNQTDSLIALAFIKSNDVKFLSVDPLTNKYPQLTPYQFASNTPICAVDLDGRESKIIINQVTTNGTVLNVATQNYIVQQNVLGVKFMTDNSGSLGHGTYTVNYSPDGNSFSEQWNPESGNSVKTFSANNISSKRWIESNSSTTRFETRLDARLVQQEAQNALVGLGFDAGNVQNDVLVLETDNLAFKGKFATFKDDATAQAYTKNWSQEKATGKNHKSTDIGRVSGELNSSGVQIKVYDGAASANDDVPNHIGFTKVNPFLHRIEAVQALLPNSNIDKSNAEKYKKTIDKNQ